MTESFESELLLESSIPWELVAEFWSLSEILTARLVSTVWLEAMEHLSPAVCTQLLSRKLQRDNILLFRDTTQWKDARNDKSMIMDTLYTKNDMTTAVSVSELSAFSSMLLCYRVCKYFPKEAVVAFNGKFGRHLLATKLNEDRSPTNVVLYDKCNRPGCITCKFRLLLAPTAATESRRRPSLRRRRRMVDDSSVEDDDTDNISNFMDIDSHFTIEDEKDCKLDLKQFFHSCVPNLPADLACPVCRTAERSLLLSEFSYRAVPGGDVRHPSLMRLTFTPDDVDDDQDNEHDDEGNDDDENGAASPVSSKRKRGGSDPNHDTTPPMFPPPMYQDMSIPTETRPLLFKHDAKHVLCLHCVKCQKFGILAPAAPCSHPQFPCQNRGALEMIGSDKKKYPTKLGGCFVRSKCSADDCYKPTLCQHCARLHFHPTFESGHSFRWTSHCPRCRTTFCQQHAWYSTSCCHI